MYSYRTFIFLVAVFSSGLSCIGLFAEDIIPSENPVSVSDTGSLVSTGSMTTEIPDTGSSDTGTTDTGSSDTGTTDTGSSDTRITDTGATEASIIAPPYTESVITQSVQAPLVQVMTVISSTPTIYSIPGYGNWSDPASWSE
jgi:hypothetical protein